MNRTDDQLLEALIHSDTAAFRELFEKYQPMLFRYMMFRLNDEEIAHDIIQETFLRVWQRRASLDPSLPILAYLYRVGGNLLKDYYKHETVRSRHAESVQGPLDGGDSPDAYAEAQLLQEEIGRVINKDLPDRCREVFVLSRVEGKSNREIAELLQLKIKSVENQITLALKILRAKLRGRG